MNIMYSKSEFNSRANYWLIAHFRSNMYNKLPFLISLSHKLSTGLYSTIILALKHNICLARSVECGNVEYEKREKKQAREKPMRKNHNSHAYTLKQKTNRHCNP